MNRGRPAGRMTGYRIKASVWINNANERGERISLARMAREIGLYDYREARRIVRDLQMLGAV